MFVLYFSYALMIGLWNIEVQRSQANFAFSLTLISLQEIINLARNYTEESQR